MRFTLNRLTGAIPSTFYRACSAKECDKMASQYLLLFVFLLTHNLLNCVSAAVHGHGPNNLERDSDGSFRGKDSEHYGDSGHNVEFDHEVILGSVKEAEEFDKLSPEESKRRLGELLPKMDLNSDHFIDRSELMQWIKRSFVKLSAEDAQERIQEADGDGDGLVTWQEYLQDTFGVDAEEDISNDDTSESGFLVQIEKLMWEAADTNGDGVLDIKEFEVLTNPEDHKQMHPYLVNQTLVEKDKNDDGQIDFKEYVGERDKQQDKTWLVAERDKFDHELDTNGDGILDREEIRAWVVPDNDEIAAEEADHLFSTADDDQDGRLSFEEVIRHYDTFVGSEATDYGSDLLGEHFDDEL